MKRNVVILDHYRDPQPVQHEINPWALAFGVSGWMWAAVWFVAWVIA